MTRPGLPIVLAPGLACSPRLFGPVMPALWRFGPVCIADTRRDDSLPEMARRLLSAAPDSFVLGGLSMGGYLALEVMRQAPRRVAALMLLDTSARPDTPEATAERQRQVEAARAGRMRDLAPLAYPRLVHGDRVADHALRKTVVEMAEEEVGAAAFIAQQQAIIGRADSRPSLPAISCPTLVVVGEQDLLTPPVLAEEMAAAIPAATLVGIPRCGHLSTLERPELVAEAMTGWLETVIARFKS